MHDNELSSTSRSSSPDTPADEANSNHESVSMLSDSNLLPFSPISRVKPQPPTISWSMADEPLKQENNFDIIFSEVIRDDILLDNQSNIYSTNNNCSPNPAANGVPSNSSQGFQHLPSSVSHLPSLPARVIFPPKDSCVNLPIVFPNIPESGTKSRVETQIKLTLDLAHGDITPDKLIGKHYHRVGSWSCLRLPPGSSSRRKPRKDPKIEALPEETLYLETTISCASAPYLRVAACLSCQNREAKRVARKIAARVRPSRSDEENQTMPATSALEDQDENHRDGNGIVQFNCSEAVDFSDGTVTLPFRITCYCRHHREKVGFKVTFVIRNHAGTVVGSGTTPPIMITDDHKTSSKTTPLTDVEYENFSPRQVSQRGQSSNSQTARKRKSKPYDGARSLTSKSSPPQSKESTPFSQVLPATPGLESPVYNPMDIVPSPTQPPKHEVITPITELLGFNSSPTTPPLPSGAASHYDSCPLTPFPFFDMPPGVTTPTPKIQRLIPASGPMHGGIEITILGSGFRSDVQLSVLFGDQRATFTQRWSDNALVCLLPAAAATGVVAVTFDGYQSNTAQVSLFTYVDDNERALMELALQVVGLKMTGKIENAKDVAMRIVGSGHDETFSSTPIDASEIVHMTSGLGSVQGLEDLLLNLLLILDLPSRSGISASKALSLRSASRQSLLHIAVQSKLLRLVDALLSRGADIDMRDRNGFTSMHFAVLRGWQEGVNLLQKSGADLEIVDILGRSPADFIIMDSIRFAGQMRGVNYLEVSDEGEEGDVEDEATSEDMKKPTRNSTAAHVGQLFQPAFDGPNLTDRTLYKQGITTGTLSIKSNIRQIPTGTPAVIYNWLRESFANLQAGAALPRGLPQMNNIYALNLAKQLPHLPELPRLPQLPTVFPGYIPIPWPAINRSDTNGKDVHSLEGQERELASNTEIMSLWKTAWEKCTAQMSQTSSQPPELHDPPPEYTETRVDEGQVQSPGETKLRKRVVNTLANFSLATATPNISREASTFEYRASRVERRISRGTRDKMLVWFWLPALLLGLVWTVVVSFGPLIEFLRQAGWSSRL